MAGFTAAQLVDASKTNVNGMVFTGLDDTNTNRPYWIIGYPFGGPVGPAVTVMDGPNTTNGGGIGNPGAWVGIGSSPKYVPAAPPAAPPVVAVPPAGDASACPRL